MYIILTELPWTISGGEINNAYTNPIVITEIIKKIRCIKNLLFKERILLGKSLLIIKFIIGKFIKI